jgi:hypothetical protein
LKIPLDSKVKKLRDIPHTISYVIRKRMQIDNLNELPKEKRPPEMMIWTGTPEEIESWINQVLSGKKQATANISFNPEDIEG